ncbi:DUF6164 family protein [Granulosicoccaceae sp. 1_MG-2023]|nr:DUF6164 family protein [Granulosicoccaceae sp. 1_MG-2023]
MARLLFPLRYVPEDEAEAVRRLLDEHEFDWYETSAGNWGISMPGIWLRDDSRLAEAQACLNDFQAGLATEARENLARARAAGEHETLWRRLRRNPAGVILGLAGIAFVLYVTLWPFLRLAQRAGAE